MCRGLKGVSVQRGGKERRLRLGVEAPAVVSMVNHLAGHAAVYANVFAGDKASFGGAEVKHHVGYVCGGTHAPGGVLGNICAGVGGTAGFYPPRGDGVNAHAPGQRNGERMSEGGDAAFGRGVALCAGHAHAVSAGGDVDNGRALCKVIYQQACEHIRCRYTHLQGVVKILPGAVGQAFEQRGCVVDEVIYPSELCNHFVAKGAQVFLFGQITHKIGVVLHIKKAHMSPGSGKLLCNAAANTLRPSCYDNHFSGKFAHACIILKQCRFVNRAVRFSRDDSFFIHPQYPFAKPQGTFCAQRCKTPRDFLRLALQNPKGLFVLSVAKSQGTFEKYGVF